MGNVVQHGALDANTNTAFPTDWYDDGTGNLQQIVYDSKQLPSGNAPVTGNLTVAGPSSPFIPIPGRGFNLSIWGSAADFSAQLNRSFDGGTTLLPIGAAISANTTEIFQEPEAGVTYILTLTSIASGTLNYRFSQ